MSKSNVYTRTGDKGETSLVGGQRVSKHHIRLESYGTVDELNSHVGMLMALNTTGKANDFLKAIQNTLFEIGSYLATDESDHPQLCITNSMIEHLEQCMDEMEGSLKKLTNFILPSGSQLVSQAHICRTICRRAERCINSLAETANINENVMKYVNRLSDYFFVLARYFSNLQGNEEINWTRSC